MANYQIDKDYYAEQVAKLVPGEFYCLKKIMPHIMLLNKTTSKTPRTYVTYNNSLGPLMYLGCEEQKFLKFLLGDKILTTTALGAQYFKRQYK